MPSFVQFDGSADYSTRTFPFGGLETPTVGTWSAWIKGDAGSVFMAIGNTAANTQVMLQTITAGTNILRGFCSNAGTTKWDLRTTAGISLNQWVHVVMTHDGATPVLYVNGTAVAQSFTDNTDVTFWVNDLTTPNVFRVGANATNSIAYYTGMIGDVTIYDICLTA